MRNLRSYVPRAEVLEDRRVLDAGTVTLDGTILRVEGTDEDDEIIVTIDEINGPSSIELNGELFELDPGDEVTEIVINTYDGDDDVDMLFPAGTIAGASGLATINLGDDDDSFTLVSSKNFRAGGTFQIDVHGEDGEDDLLANLKGANIQADTLLTLNMWGDDDEDRIRVRHKGRVIGDADIMLDGGADDDRINVEARFRPLEGGGVAATDTFFLEVFGGEDDDKIGVFITQQPDADYPVVASVDGGSGDDVTVHTPNVTATNCESNTTIVL